MTTIRHDGRGSQAECEIAEPASPAGVRRVLVGHGRSNMEIATDLGITERTARTHVSNVLGKLDLQSRTQAAIYAVERKLVKE